MAIIGLGMDAVELSRIENRGRTETKVLTQQS